MVKFFLNLIDKNFLGLAVLFILVIIVKGACPLLLPIVSLQETLMAPSSKHIHQILTRYHFTLSRKSNIGLTQLAPSAHSGQKYQIWVMKIYLDIEF